MWFSLHQNSSKDLLSLLQSGFCLHHSTETALGNFDEIDQFFTTPKVSHPTQEEKGNLNSPISIKEIDFVLKSLPTKKTPGPNIFTGKSTQPLIKK